MNILSSSSSLSLKSLSSMLTRRITLNVINNSSSRIYHHHNNNNHYQYDKKRMISTVLWIKGLNETTKEEDVKTMLLDYGTVTYMRLFTVSERSKIVNVIVRFQRVNDALAAMDELQLTPIQGRRAVFEFGKSDLVNRKSVSAGNKKKWK